MLFIVWQAIVKGANKYQNRQLKTEHFEAVYQCFILNHPLKLPPRQDDSLLWKTSLNNMLEDMSVFVISLSFMTEKIIMK